MEFNVQKWTQFLPPLTPVTVTRLNNIAPTFENIKNKNGRRKL